MNRAGKVGLPEGSPAQAHIPVVDKGDKRAVAGAQTELTTVPGAIAQWAYRVDRQGETAAHPKG